MTVCAAQASVAVFDPVRLVKTFARCFAESEQTELVGGAEEPLYQPAQQSGRQHQLLFRQDYFASALHEVSHWCIAGAARRQQRDFGYWYAPDGRDARQQLAFESVEYKPQALEWLFSLACAYPFRLSLDNLGISGSEIPDTEPFRLRVFEQARLWQEQGLPGRAATFFAALAEEFGTHVQLETLSLSLAELR